jgi:hypothetical protein
MISLSIAFRYGSVNASKMCWRSASVRMPVNGLEDRRRMASSDGLFNLIPYSQQNVFPCQAELRQDWPEDTFSLDRRSYFTGNLDNLHPVNPVPPVKRNPEQWRSAHPLIQLSWKN